MDNTGMNVLEDEEGIEINEDAEGSDDGENTEEINDYDDDEGEFDVVDIDDEEIDISGVDTVKVKRMIDDHYNWLMEFWLDTTFDYYDAEDTEKTTAYLLWILSPDLEKNPNMYAALFIYKTYPCFGCMHTCGMRATNSSTARRD